MCMSILYAMLLLSYIQPPSVTTPSPFLLLYKSLKKNHITYLFNTFLVLSARKLSFEAFLFCTKANFSASLSIVTIGLDGT